MKGRIIGISRYCTDDGPGIRTTVFLKGCPLSCLWCHNPESQRIGVDILYSREKCVGCRRCEAVCPAGCHAFGGEAHRFDREGCLGCQECAKVCPAGALEAVGREIEARKVFDEVVRDAVFYEQSGGGVTLSGGEPLSQPGFAAEILRLCREAGIPTAIETSGFAGEAAVRSVLRYCDLALFDLKESDEERHLRYTGVSRRPILQTLEIIGEMGIPFWIRMPIVPGYNDRAEHFEAARQIRRRMSNCQRIEIMPYHVLGRYKYEQLSRPYLCADVAEPAPETANLWRAAVEGE